MIAVPAALGIVAIVGLRPAARRLVPVVATSRRLPVVVAGRAAALVATLTVEVSTVVIEITAATVVEIAAVILGLVILVVRGVLGNLELLIGVSC